MEIPPCRNTALLHRVVFHGLARTFFMGSPVLFSWARIKVNRKTIWPHLCTAFSNPGKPPLFPTRAHLICLFSQNDSFQMKLLLYLTRAFQKMSGHSMAQENSQPNHNFEEHRLWHNQVLDTLDHILYRLFCVRTTDFVKSVVIFLVNCVLFVG